MRNWTFDGLVLAILCVVGAGFAAAEDWTGFRGTGGLGIGAAENLPVSWDAEKNIVWKQDLPGPGSSSPVVVGSRIYLTCYSGYGLSVEEPGDTSDLVRHVVCIDRKTGKIIGSKKLKAKTPESNYKPGNESRHGYASSTIATDGEHLFVFCGVSGVYCLDIKGNVVWNADVGSGTHGWGSGTSPLLYKNLAIVNASIESNTIYGLDKSTGDVVWEVPQVTKCWSSPMLVDVGGKQEMVLNMPHQITGFDPATGKQLWRCEGIPDGYVCPSVVSNDGVVYAIGGRKNTAIAVRAGGRGDVTDSHVLWRVGKGNNVSSPVYHDEHLYWFHESRGITYCLNAETGETVYEERIDPSPGLVYSSVTMADGKFYVVSQGGATYVLVAKPEFEQLAVNVFEDDDTRTNASIVVHDNQLIMRTDKAIYCIGQ